MQQEVMNRSVRDDLKHIPRGDIDQNIPRSTYSMLRRHDLASEPLTSKRDSLIAAIDAITRDKPAFRPTYDASYFENCGGTSGCS